jgi:hypothetical protein
VRSGAEKPELPPETPKEAGKPMERQETAKEQTT